MLSKSTNEKFIVTFKACSSLLMICRLLFTAEAYVGFPTKSEIGVPRTSISKPKLPIKDTTKIGSLTVPSVGTGTISWSSDSVFDIESKELEKVVSTAYKNNAAFFDTAERYGSHWKTTIWVSAKTCLKIDSSNCLEHLRGGSLRAPSGHVCARAALIS